MDVLKANYVEGFLAETMVWENCVQRGAFWNCTDNLVKLIQLSTVLGKQKHLPWELDWLHNPPLVKTHPDIQKNLFGLMQIDRGEIFKSFHGFDLHPAIQVMHFHLDIFGQSIIDALSKRPELLTNVERTIVNAFVLNARHSLNSTSLQSIRKRFIASSASRLREATGYAARLQSKHGGLVVFNLIAIVSNKPMSSNSKLDPESFARQCMIGLSKTFNENLVGFIWKHIDLPGKPAIFDLLIFLSPTEIVASPEELINNMSAETSLPRDFFATPYSNQSGIMFPMVLTENNAQSREQLKAVIMQKFSDGYFFQKPFNGRRKSYGYGKN